MFDKVYYHVSTKEVTGYYIPTKGREKYFPFTVEHLKLVRIDYRSETQPHTETDLHHCLRFTTIMGRPSGLSFPEFFYVWGRVRILWYGIVASFDGKQVLMVVYFSFEKDCIAHETFLIQCHEATYLTPSLYARRRGRDRESYESFRCLRVEIKHRFFSQKIKANRFEVDSYYGSKALERTGRLLHKIAKIAILNIKNLIL